MMSQGVAAENVVVLLLYRRTEIGVAVVSSTAAHAVEVLHACERYVAARPEIELLSARQRIFSEGSEREMDAARARRLGEAIAQIVAEMLERRVKDPRLGFVTVTEARITGDLREATVFYTVYGSAQERADTAAALTSATGLIRSEVGRQTGLKHTPSITFREDTVPDTARNIEELVARARDADAAVAAARQGATPAGDADPYRIPAGRPTTRTTRRATMPWMTAAGPVIRPRAAGQSAKHPRAAITARDTRGRDWRSRATTRPGCCG